MAIEGYVGYRRREYCRAVRCPVQMKLNALDADSDEYQEVRQTCRTACVHTTWEFHHWLIERGYLIVRAADSR